MEILSWRSGKYLDRGASDGCRHTCLAALRNFYRPSSRGYHHHVVQALARAAGVSEDRGWWRGLRVLARTAGVGKQCWWRENAGGGNRCDVRHYVIGRIRVICMESPLAKTGELYPLKSKTLEPWSALRSLPNTK
jgi:hypothetical protein